MLDRLQNAFERLSAFSSDLAHDLRTPVGNLLGEAQVALSRPRSAAEYRSVLESAVEEYERLSRMIGNMLFLASADNEQAALSAGWVDLAPALDRVIGYFELLAEERGVVLERSVRPSPSVALRVWADETMLVRALSNLVSNALRHAESGSRVEIAAQVEPAGGCTIEVSNTGPAIAGEQQPGSSSASTAPTRRATARPRVRASAWPSFARSWSCTVAARRCEALRTSARCSACTSRRRRSLVVRDDGEGRRQPPPRGRRRSPRSPWPRSARDRIQPAINARSSSGSAGLVRW
jgi:two-component system heavy metal sensor histidine kinase CusS